MAETKGFTKTDMERVALFQEMSYVTIGDAYKVAATSQFNTEASKGKQMLAPGIKERDGTKVGYFSEFTRVMEGEAYSDPIKMRRQNRIKESQKNLGKPFIPTNGDKKPSGAGSHYGTLSGKIEHFSPVKRPGLEYKHENKNFYTNPGKKGTGYGYNNVTLGKSLPYKPDEYDRARDSMKKENEDHKKSMKGTAFRLNMHPTSYFDQNPFKSDRPARSAPRESSTKRDVKPFKPSSPGKLAGGLKAGTFDPYPQNFGGPATLGVKYSKNIVNNSGKTFAPNRFPKTAPQVSIVNHNVHKYVNPANSKTIQAVMCY